jgi:hypothetical protein
MGCWDTFGVPETENPPPGAVPFGELRPNGLMPGWIRSRPRQKPQLGCVGSRPNWGISTTSSPNIGVNSGSADPALKPNATTAMTKITPFTNASRSHASSRISSSALIAAGHGRPHSCHEHFPRTPHHCRESRALMSMCEIRMPAVFSYAGRSRSRTNVWIAAGHLTQRTGVR